jgi:hypothetical protein
MRSRISTVYTQRASGKKQVAHFEKGMVSNNKEKKLFAKKHWEPAQAAMA